MKLGILQFTATMLIVVALFSHTFLLGIPIHWIFCPSYHGKGDCDGHGATVKKKIRRWVLNSMFTLS